MRHHSSDGLPCEDKSYTVGIAVKTGMGCTFAPNLEGMLETIKGGDQRDKLPRLEKDLKHLHHHIHQSCNHKC